MHTKAGWKCAYCEQVNSCTHSCIHKLHFLVVHDSIYIYFVHSMQVKTLCYQNFLAGNIIFWGQTEYCIYTTKNNKLTCTNVFVKL